MFNITDVVMRTLIHDNKTIHQKYDFILEMHTNSVNDLRVLASGIRFLRGVYKIPGRDVDRVPVC